MNDIETGKMGKVFYGSVFVNRFTLPFSPSPTKGMIIGVQNHHPTHL
jgi:hypothetical protein